MTDHDRKPAQIPGRKPDALLRPREDLEHFPGEHEQEWPRVRLDPPPRAEHSQEDWAGPGIASMHLDWLSGRRCEARARRGTGTGICGLPLDDLGQCSRASGHL